MNLPYPGVFVLDENGIVTRKIFHESYRERDSGGGLVAQVLGIFSEPPTPATGATPAVTMRAWLDSPTYTYFQRLTLTVEVAAVSGHHVYGQPTPAGLVPLSVAIDPVAGLEVGHTTWPAPHRFALPRLGDEMWVHDGTVRGTLLLTSSASASLSRRATRRRVSCPRRSGWRCRFARSHTRRRRAGTPEDRACRSGSCRC